MVLRWLFWFAGFVTVLIAITTSTGRVLVLWLDDLEPQLNSLLDARGIELRGFKGDWRGLNPIISADSIRFNGGQARDVTFELDLLESALHSSLVARRLDIGAMELALVRNPDGVWQLGGEPIRALPISIAALLWESDSISMPNLRLRFYDQRPDDQRSEVVDEAEDPWILVGDFEGSVATRNSDRAHAGVLRLWAADPSCKDCGVTVRYALHESLLGLGGAGVATVDAAALTISPALGIALGAAGGVLEEVHGRWHIESGEGRGKLDVALRDLRLGTGSLDEVAFRVEARAENDLESWRARIGGLRIVAGPEPALLELADIDVSGHLEDSLSDFALTVGFVDLGVAADVVHSALAGIPIVDTWLAGLNVAGEAHAVQVRLNPAEGQIGYSARLTNLSSESFKGVPKLRRADAAVTGYEQGLELVFDEDDIVLGFPGVFERDSEFQGAQGAVYVWFEPGYLGIRSENLRLVTGDTHAVGGFVLSRPKDRYEQHLAIFADIHDMSVTEIRHYVPRKLSRELVGWLGEALLSGHVNRALVAYQGHIRTHPGKLMRHTEISGDAVDATIRYHADWPVATGLNGDIRISRAGTHVDISSGSLLDLELKDMRVFVPRVGDYAEVDGLGRGSAAAVLRVIRESPLIQWLPQVDESWTAAGDTEFAVDLRVPLGVDEERLDIELELNLARVTLDLRNLGLTLQDLSGEVRYQHPFVVAAEPMAGRLFDRPASYAIETIEGEVRLALTGHVTTDEVNDWLELGDHGLLDGEADFTATLAMRPDEAPRLEVVTALEGVTIALPPPFGKPASEPRPTRLKIGFDEGFTGIEIAWPDIATGWVRLMDAGGLSGFIRVGASSDWVPAPQDRDGLTVVGRIESADLSVWSDLLALVEDSDSDQRWTLPGFEVDRAYVGDVVFDDLLIDASGGGDGMRVSVEGPQLKGTLAWRPPEAMQVAVEYISFPAGEEEAGDPLEGIDLSRMPDLDVVVSEILIGESSYGEWAMKIRRDAQGFAVHDLTATIKGLRIEGSTPGHWNTSENVTRFAGLITTANLAEVLPQWDYAASIESESARLKADLSWPGSPLNFDLWDTSGRMDVDIKKGRFLDVQSGSGTVRIFGLFNLAALAKRMTLDFSDVFGKGISFDQVTAQTQLVDGFMTFTQPMEVEGTGGSFRLAGTVDLESGKLDNEMVVTLPVSASLPWYAAYLSVFANPILGGAVFVGERLFRDQIESFSSAKYRISGTLDDPNVTFVQVFSKSIDGSAQAETDANEEEPSSDGGATDS